MKNSFSHQLNVGDPDQLAHSVRLGLEQTGVNFISASAQSLNRHRSRQQAVAQLRNILLEGRDRLLPHALCIR